MKVVLVVPCYNEADRIQLESFSANSEIKYLFVNDGSTDGTSLKLSPLLNANNRLLELPVNKGKAESVRQGMLEAYKLFPEAEWIGYWDADLATPLSQCAYMLSFNQINDSQFSAIWGSRLMRLGANISRNIWRHFLGRLFVTISSLILKTQAYDSQCGAKLFKRNIVVDCFKEEFISRWLFDLEILMRLEHKKIPVLECPLQDWQDVKGSRLKLFKDGFLGLLELLRIRKKYAPHS